MIRCNVHCNLAIHLQWYFIRESFVSLGLFYDEDGDLTGIYTLKKINDKEYRDSASSKKITFMDSGTISINGTLYYN